MRVPPACVVDRNGHWTEYTLIGDDAILDRCWTEPPHPDKGIQEAVKWGAMRLNDDISDLVAMAYGAHEYVGTAGYAAASELWRAFDAAVNAWHADHSDQPAPAVLTLDGVAWHRDMLGHWEPTSVVVLE